MYVLDRIYMRSTLEAKNTKSHRAGGRRWLGMAVRAADQGFGFQTRQFLMVDSSGSTVCHSRIDNTARGKGYRHV